jgi:hypothetical protein
LLNSCTPVGGKDLYAVGGEINTKGISIGEEERSRGTKMCGSWRRGNERKKRRRIKKGKYKGGGRNRESKGTVAIEQIRE